MNINKKKKIIVIGAGGFAVSIIDIILSNGYEIKYFVDKESKLKNLFNYPIKNNLNKRREDSFSVIIALGSNFKRYRTVQKLKSKYKNISFPTMIDKSAIIGRNCSIGKGSIIMTNTYIGINTNVKEFCIINTKASIDHDSVMKNFSSLAPGVTTGGNVKIGERTALCIGAIIKDKVSISYDTVIGANSFVNKNLRSTSVYYGSPAKLIRKRSISDEYL